MKKFILFFTLLFAGITANAQYSPSNNLNYVKLLKAPPVGSAEDSIIVYDGSDSFIKIVPKSAVVAGKENTSNKTSAVVNYSETLYTNEKAVHDGLNLKLNISDLPTNLTLYPTTTASDVSGYVVMVTDIQDVRYNSTAVDVSTPAITTTSQLVSQRISDAGVLIGQPGVFNITTFGNIRHLSGSGTATFFFRVYHRDAAGVETLICTSSTSNPVTNGGYTEFSASGVWNDGDFAATDRIVIKSYANRIAGGSDPVYQFQFGGAIPVRTLLPVPFSVVDAGYEMKTNKQNSLAVDGSGIKYPTVDSVNDKLKTVNSFNPTITKWAGLGDSITVGMGSTGGNTSYFNIISDMFPFISTTKIAVSGATVVPTVGHAQLSDLVDDVPIDANLITVMIGVNDFIEERNVGDVYEVSTKDYSDLNQNNSFAEAFRYNLETLKNNFPLAKIIVITPIQSTIGWDSTIPLKLYVDVEIEIANFLSIPVIDAYSNSGVYGEFSPYFDDTVHPNDSGYALIAKQVVTGFIHNPENKESSFFNTLKVADGVSFGRSDQSQNDSNIVFKGLRGVGVNGILELYPYGSNTPSTILRASGVDIGGGFSYFDAGGGNYGFGTKTDNGVDKVQINGSALVNKLKYTRSTDVSGTDLNNLDVAGFYCGDTMLNSPDGTAGAFYITVERYEFDPALTHQLATTFFSNTMYSRVKAGSWGAWMKISYTDSPTLTGTPIAPTAPAGTNTTQIATTAFVKENTDATQHWTKSGSNIYANNSGNVMFDPYGFGTGYNYTTKSIVGFWTNGSFTNGSIGVTQSNDGVAMYLSSLNAWIYGGIGRDMNIGTLKTDGVINSSINNINKTITSNDRFESLVPIKLKSYTVATLPTGVQGDTAFVTDALAPSYLVTIVGGGSIVTPVFFNGTVWVAH